MSLTVTLQNGVSMPLIGLGTWKLKEDEIPRAIDAALDAGYRHFDCALVYGNEKEVGAALKNGLERLNLKREDIFVTTKLWNTFHDKENVEKCLDKSLSDLQLDYVDLYLMHWPLGFKFESPTVMFPRTESGTIAYSDVHFLDTWEVLEGLVDAGKCRAIGASNFNSKQLDEIISKRRIPPAVNQVESHPYFPQVDLLSFCRERGVVLSAYSPLGCGDRAWKLEGEPNIFDDPKIQKIAQRLGKSLAQVAIRFQVQRGLPVLPKSATPSRVQENINIFDFELSEEDMSILTSLPKRRVLVPPVKDKDNRPVVDASGLPVPRDAAHPFFPFHEPF